MHSRSIPKQGDRRHKYAIGANVQRIGGGHCLRPYSTETVHVALGASESWQVLTVTRKGDCPASAIAALMVAEKLSTFFTVTTCVPLPTKLRFPGNARGTRWL